MAYGGVSEYIRIADDRVEVAFGRRDEVDIVHQDGSRKVFPSLYTILKEAPSQHHPCRTYAEDMLV